MEKASHHTCQHNQHVKSSLPFNHNHELNLARQIVLPRLTNLKLSKKTK